MADMPISDIMLETYIFETNQLVEQLEQLIIDGEKNNDITSLIDDIFRIMHTIKGSSAMMDYNNISELSHCIEDLFFYIRENNTKNLSFCLICDLILNSIDFIKNELLKIQSGKFPDGNASKEMERIRTFLENIKKGKVEYIAVLYFEDGCEMENIRAYTVVQSLSDFVNITKYIPEDIMEDDEGSIKKIKESGFQIFFDSELDIEIIKTQLENIVLLKKFEILLASDNEQPCSKANEMKDFQQENDPQIKKVPSLKQNQEIINVSIGKTDKLMNLIGELVIAEAMVTENSDLKNLKLDNFKKSARQLKKIIGELQDVAMSIRMTPLSTTFYKMNRIVRDMCNKMNKQVTLEILGEDTEVDKNVIEHISDPLMHLVRNAIDHGIEKSEYREKIGKSLEGVITLEAKNAGSEVLIIVKDDGQGLNKNKILQKAREKGMLIKPIETMTDDEIYNLIFLPGFSTNDAVNEYSGRGVGMDVVTSNIEAINGTVSIESVEGEGTTFTIKIPVSLAIIDGMNIMVGKSFYTIPTSEINESIRINSKDIICDYEGNEMIMVRGECYPIMRLHKYFKIETEITKLEEGILVIVEHHSKKFCIFTDKLLGEQQVVVKTMPNYIKNFKKISGLGGCTLLGDGSISLILDVEGLFKGNHFST